MKLWNRNREMAGAKGATSSRALVEGRLALCTEALKAADANLSRLSLQAVQSGDDAAALAAQDHLRKLENQHGLLTAALCEAERQDQERQKELRAQQNQSAKHALAQHRGSFNRAAGEVAKAIADLQDARQRLEASGGSIVALLPAHMRTGALPFHELLGSQSLSDAVACEAYRIGDRKGRKPRGLQEDYRTGHIRPMVDILSAHVAHVREDFDFVPQVQKAISSEALADDGAPTVDRCPSPPVDGPAASVSPRRLTGVMANASSGELVELTERFATESPQEPAEPPVRSLTVDTPETDAEATGKALTTRGVDYTKLF
jgi:hypothetical protein